MPQICIRLYTNNYKVNCVSKWNWLSQTMFRLTNLKKIRIFFVKIFAQSFLTFLWPKRTNIYNNKNLQFCILTLILTIKGHFYSSTSRQNKFYIDFIEGQLQFVYKTIINLLGAIINLAIHLIPWWHYYYIYIYFTIFKWVSIFVRTLMLNLVESLIIKVLLEV